MNRITKGKTLVGSLDVRGNLEVEGNITINGVPVGSGGGTGGTPLTYTGWLSTDSMYDSERWYIGMSPFVIQNNAGAPFPRSAYQQNFLADNNVVLGDLFDVSLEYWNGMNWQTSRTNSDIAGYFFYGVCVYDMMWNANVIKIGSYGTATYSMGMTGYIPRFTLKKKAD